MQKLTGSIIALLLFGLAGLATGILQFLAFAPYELYGTTLLALLGFYLILRHPAHWGLKSLAFALSQIIFFHLFHQKNEWYLELASHNSPERFMHFRLAALFQYSLGGWMVYSLGAYVKRWVRPGMLSLLAALVCALHPYFSTTNHDNGFLTPLLASPLISAVATPYFIYLFISFGFIFAIFEFGLQKQKRNAVLALSGLVLFWGANNVLALKQKPLPANLIVMAAHSYNLDDKTAAMVEEHFLKLKPSSIPTTPVIYYWPEALVTFKAKHADNQKMLEDVFTKHYPGIHYYGAYSVKGSLHSYSKNQYCRFDTATGVREEIGKAFPVPFQEDADLFWLIDPKKIDLSFNVKSSRIFGRLPFPEREAGFYLCNEIADLRQILAQDKALTDLILVPSNPPMQNVEYYEKVLNFYMRAISKIKNVPVLKTSSQVEIYLVQDGKEQKLQQPSCYQTECLYSPSSSR